MHLRTAPLAPADRREWERLARGYKAFYRTDVSDDDYDLTWTRLLEDDGVHGLGAYVDNRLLGIAHYFFHTSIWASTVCYLQDLFVDEDARGHGVARTLIETIADAARSRDADRFYWHTQDHNATARLLYDKVADFNGFVRYDYALGSTG